MNTAVGKHRSGDELAEDRSSDKYYQSRRREELSLGR